MKPVDLFWKGAAIRGVTAELNSADFVSRVDKAYYSGLIPRRNYALRPDTENPDISLASYHKLIREQFAFCQETNSDEEAFAIMLTQGVTCLLVKNGSGTVTGRVEMDAVICAIIAKRADFDFQ